MSNPKSVNIAAYLVLLVSIALGVLVLFAFQPDEAAQPAGNQIQLGGDFTLQSASGPVSLEDYRGQAVVLFFGFTSCPDVCPTSMAVLNSAIQQLPEAQQEQIQGIFVSVDPERDTPQKLAEYVSYFNDDFVGLSGDLASTDKLVRQYGAYYRKVELQDSALDYTIDHTARLYLIGPDGRLQGTSAHNTSPAQLAEQLQQLLSSDVIQGS